MSSQTLNHLRTFDGRDLADWDATARYIINATGCHMALGAQPSPTFDEKGNETEDSHKARENWEDQNAKAFGNLMLRISPDIRKLIVQARKESTKDLLEWLKTQYGTTTISAAYTDVIAINKLFIPGDCDPTPVIDKLRALFTRLEDNKLIYPEPLRAVTFLSKLPAQMEEIARNYNRKTADATSLTFSAIRDDAIMSWQQCSSKGKNKIQSDYQIYSKKARTLTSISNNCRRRVRVPTLAGHVVSVVEKIAVNANSSIGSSCALMRTLRNLLIHHPTQPQLTYLAVSAKHA